MTTFRVTTEVLIQAASAEAAAEEAARTPPERFVVYSNGYLEVTDVVNTFTIHDGDIVAAEIVEDNDEAIHGRWDKEQQRYEDGCKPGAEHHA